MKKRKQNTSIQVLPSQKDNINMYALHVKTYPLFLRRQCCSVKIDERTSAVEPGCCDPHSLISLSYPTSKVTRNLPTETQVLLVKN